MIYKSIKKATYNREARIELINKGKVDSTKVILSLISQRQIYNVMTKKKGKRIKSIIEAKD